MSSLHRELKQTRPFTSLEHEAFLNLQRTANALAGPMDRLLKAQGISPAQYNVLRILRGQPGPGLACTPIGERMVTRVPDVTRLIDKLVSMGLTKRHRSETDRRVVLNSITAAGRRLLRKLDTPTQTAHKNLLGHLTERELRSLNKLLVKARTPIEGD